MESSCALSAPHRKSTISFETLEAGIGGFGMTQGDPEGDREVIKNRNNLELSPMCTNSNSCRTAEPKQTITDITTTTTEIL